MDHRSKFNQRYLKLVKAKQECSSCDAYHFCFADTKDDECSKVLDGLIHERGPYKPGDTIYRRGDHFKSLFAIQSGLIKTEVETRDGRLNVTGFHMLGDLFGLEAIGSKHYPGNATVIKEAWICEIPYKGLMELCEATPSLHSQFLARMGQRIQADEYQWKTIRGESAELRLLYFLQDLSQRQQRIAEGGKFEVELQMSKQDIANFLGLSAESLSRTLKKLQERGWIDKPGKNLIHFDPEAVAEVI